MSLPKSNLDFTCAAGQASPPSSPWQIQTVKLQHVQSELPDVATYDLAFEDATFGEAYRLKPGQFNMLYVPGVGEAAISVSDDPRRIERDVSCRHTIRAAGRVTGMISRMEPGDTLGLRGPFGRAWPMDECVGRDVLLVAGGIGLAPLRPVIYSLLARPEAFGRLHLLYGTRNPESLLYEEEFAAWTEQGLEVHSTVDRASPGWRGNVGVVTSLLDGLLSFDPENTVLFSCGPEIMMKFSLMAALERGIPQERLWLSMERNMQCAVGLCGHCQLGPAFVCKDGPVFRFDEMKQYMNVGGF